MSISFLKYPLVVSPEAPEKGDEGSELCGLLIQVLWLSDLKALRKGFCILLVS